MAMGSRPLLLLGNIVAIVVTIVAFVQAISWPVAGVDPGIVGAARCWPISALLGGL